MYETPFGAMECPARFEVEIEGNETLDTLVGEVVENIKGNPQKGEGCADRLIEKIIGNIRRNIKRNKIDKGCVWPAFDYTAETLFKVTDEGTGTAGFVLLNEVPVVGIFRCEREGIYGIKKRGNILKGLLLDAGEYDYDHKYHFLVDKIEDGVLKYTVIRDKAREYEFDLKNL